MTKNINSKLDVPWATQEEVLASEMVGRGISCVSLRQRYGRNGGTKGQAEGAAQQAGLFWHTTPIARGLGDAGGPSR